MDKKGRAIWPSLFVFGAAVVLLAAALLQGNVFRWGAITLLGLALFLMPSRVFPANALAASMLLFCGWLLCSAVFLTPSYLSESLFRPCIFLLSFAVGAAIGRTAQVWLFRAAIVVMALLVLLGLLQFFFGFWHLAHNPVRAAAVFVTPNTFATAINLVLLPLVALTLARRGSTQTFLLVLWLFAGLLATESRGGWLGGGAGLAFIAWYLGVPRSREGRKPWLRLIAGLLAVFIAFSAALRLAPSEAGIAASFGETVVSRGSSFRTEIALVALGEVRNAPLAGAGANMFRNLMEMRKPVELDIGHTFQFVHNDYLQTLLEFGIVGLALLGAVLVAAIRMLLRARRARSTALVPLLCGAAVAGVFAHAAVDFPLYIPFLLCVAGIWLGALANTGGDSPRLAWVSSLIGKLTRFLRTAPIAGALSLAALAWLAQPALADYATNRALSGLGAGRSDIGAYWQSVARRLEPYNGLHYWAEGVIWRDQAVEGRDRALAERADMLFSEGMRVDRYQIANHLERARFHRQHPDLFEGRTQNVLEWTSQALKLRPYSLIVQAEHARALAGTGQIEDAKLIVREMVARHPHAGMARGLAEEFGLRVPSSEVK